MKILFVNRDNYDTVGGGDAVQMLKTKAALEALGAEVTLKKCGEVEQTDLRDFHLAHLFNIQTYTASWSAMQILKRHKIPVALSTIYWDAFDHLADMAGQDHRLWSKVRRVLGRDGFRKFYIGRMRKKYQDSNEFRTQKQLLDAADVLLPNSHSEGVLLNEIFQTDYSAKTVPIVNAIDVGIYPPDKPSPYLQDKFGIQNPILEIGRISSVKNQLRVIQALHDSKIPLVFIGQTEHANYAAECRRLGEKRGNVFFIEKIPHDELPGIYASARVHVLPSWRETPGLVSLEAAAAGCRIVTTTIGSTRDYFGEDAWYVFPDDTQGIRKAILAAYDAPPNPALAERILREFNWKRTAEQTLAAYRSVLKA